MKFKMIHENYNVSDLQASLDFYEKALGLTEVRRKVAEDGSFIIVYVGNEEADFELELTYNYDPEKPYDLGTGYGHIAVEVDDLLASYEEHQAKGYEVGPLKGLGDTKDYYFLTDPDGYKIEVMRKK